MSAIKSVIIEIPQIIKNEISRNSNINYDYYKLFGSDTNIAIKMTTTKLMTIIRGIMIITSAIAGFNYPFVSTINNIYYHIQYSGDDIATPIHTVKSKLSYQRCGKRSKTIIQNNGNAIIFMVCNIAQG